MFAIVGNKDVYTKEDARRLHKNQYSSKQCVELMDVTEVTQGNRIRQVGYSPGKNAGNLERSRQIRHRARLDLE